MSDRLNVLEARYRELQGKGLNLDMTRGKPCSQQLDLSNEMITVLGSSSYKAKDGTDCRNYGGLDGIPEAKALFAEFLNVSKDEIIIGGNSSLNLMYDTVVRCLLFGVPGGSSPWGKAPIKFLCPAPGYDRHFAICDALGIEMIAVTLNHDGPDMEEVARLVATDESIKGIWCVPRYANPTGATYSSAVIKALAQMKTAASDFRVMYDNAYAVHHLYDDVEPLEDILAACKAAGNPNRVLLFGSTSKISFAGAGVAVMGGSKENMDHAKKYLAFQTIGPDKLNQLRHVAFFKDMGGIEAHMHKHAKILRPKFEMVLSILERELGGLGVATWTKPRGGYFVSLDVVPQTARKVVSLAEALGVKLTGAGATFPYNKDPQDRNIRIAPTLPSLNEIEQAMEALAVCVQLAALRR